MTLGAQALTPSRRRFLRYWSLNMTLARTFGWVWMPGFTYGPNEWRRFEALAAAIPRRAVSTWLLATALIFILLDAVATTGVLGVALTESGYPLDFTNPPTVAHPCAAGCWSRRR